MGGKNRGYHEQAIKRHFSGELRGLAHNQLFQQRGLRGATLGPANRGRRLDAVVDQKVVDDDANGTEEKRAEVLM